MELSKLKSQIQDLAKEIYAEKKKTTDNSLAYDELTKFPELKQIIIDLLTIEFDKFLESIDWVAPRPTTFRINLLNNQNFILIFTERSWIAQVEGKKYYLLNLDEEEHAAEAVARILQYGAAVDKKGDEFDDFDKPSDVKPTKKTSTKKENPTPPEEETPDEEK